MEDITETGPVGLKGLPGLNRKSSNRSINDILNAREYAIKTGNVTPEGLSRQYNAGAIENVGLDLMNKGYGDSIYDTDNTNESTLNDLNEFRAKEQSGISQIANGLAKGAVLAGTTFLDGTIGLLVGAGTAINEGRWSGLWDNDFSKAMQSVNEWSEQALPNYYTRAEQEQPWYENIFTTNFLGDKFIKNLGFTVGAFYSGGVTAAGLKVTKLPQLIGAIAKSSKAPAIVNTAVGATISAVNEGRIEALNNSKDWFELHKAQLDDSLRERLNAIQAEYEANAGKELVRSGVEGNQFVDSVKYQDAIAKEREAYNAALGKLNEDRLKMGNADLLMNIPILTASNIIQFGKLYANGFKTARKATNIVGKAGEYTAGTTRLGAATAITKGALSEGTEEMAQGAASRIAGNYYSTDVNNFYKSKTDPEAAQETLSWTKSFAEGINETVNDGSVWEEFFIGSLTGALGMPRFRGVRNAQGGIQSPITIEGGAINEWRDYNEKIARENEIANYMNSRINSPEFKNYYQGLIRHNKYQNDMNRAAEEGDEFNFKNAEHAQLVSDISMFDNAGKLEDLITLIDSAVDNFSDEELASIVKNTTRNITKDEQINNLSKQAKDIQTQIDELSSNIESSEGYLKGYKRKNPARDASGKFSTEDNNINASGRAHVSFTKENINKSKEKLDSLNKQLKLIQEQINKASDKKVGPFIDEKGNPVYATTEGRQKMVAKLTENKSTITNTINNYLKIKDDLDIKTGQQLSDEQLEELTWMKSQIGNWAERATTMSGEVKSAIGDVIGNLDSFLRFNQQVRDFEGQSNADITERYLQADKNVRATEGAVNTLNMVRGQDDKVLAHTLATNPKFVDGLIKEINEVDETVLSADEKEDITTKLNDIVKLGNASKTYNAKLKEYLENPQKQAEDHTKADEQAAQRETKKKSDSLKTSLNTATTLRDFRTIVESQDDAENRDKVLEEMENDGNAMAKNYRETSQYNSEVRRVINESDVEPQVKQDALKLLQDQFSNSENLEQLANPNSIYINNGNAFDEDSGGDVDLSATRFLNAQYELQKAMSKINNDNRFKDRFSPEYKRLVEKSEGTSRGVDKDTTGDSGTSTIPSVNDNVNGDTKDNTAVTYPEDKIPAGNITKEMVAEENKQLSDRVEMPEKPKSTERRKFYRPAIPELHIEASKEGDFRPFNIVIRGRAYNNFYNQLSTTEKERVNDYINEHNIEEPSAETIKAALIDNEGNLIPRLQSLYDRNKESFDVIYNHLKNEGVFEYLNEGNLKAGDEIGFMIDPEFEKKVEGADWHKAPTIFLINKKDGHIVGSLDESGYSVSRYEGLTELEERIRKEYADREKKEGRFIATPTTKVSKMMTGKVSYGNEEKSLKDIPNVSKGKGPIFGIIRNGVIVTNGGIANANDIINPSITKNNEGRLYLLIPNGAGKYSPVAVRVKHFNKEEFDINDVNLSSTVLGESIKKGITDLSNALSQTDVSEAMQKLGSNIHLQDVHIAWYDTNTEAGIEIRRDLRKPNGEYRKVIINGEEHIESDKEKVVFVSRPNADTLLNIGSSGEAEYTTNEEIETDKDEVTKKILDILYRFNLPIQVSARSINTPGYNARYINANVLTSNITDASVKGTWFTTEYFDSEGNLQSAINPASIARQDKNNNTPVGGTNSAIKGTRIDYTDAQSLDVYDSYIDLTTNTIRDFSGKDVTSSIPNDVKEILFDLAWAQDNFGDTSNSSIMVNNKIVTPSGKVLDRTNKWYLNDKDAQEVKDIIAGRKREKEAKIKESNRVIDEIYENQKKVDKTRTDKDFYYVLEDDGQYHQYSRVHSRIGSSFEESKEVKLARINLKEFEGKPTHYNNYLTRLERIFKLDLSQYKGKTDAENTQKVIDELLNSNRSLQAGTAVDSIIRQYFTVKDISKIERPDNISEKAFIDLITKLNEIKSKMESSGERFFSDNIVLFQKYPDGTRIAGEVDILSIDSNGNFRIYDVKTSGYSFTSDRGLNLFKWTVNGSKATKQEVQNYIDRNFSKPFKLQADMSTEDYYTLQLSAYKNLFESQYGVPVTKLAIMPFVLTYDSTDRNKVAGIQDEKGIPITYNPSVNVPLIGSVKDTPAVAAQQQVVPIFDSSLELQKPIEDLSPLHSFGRDDEKVGYFELEGKLHKGYILPLTIIDGIDVYVTKIPGKLLQAGWDGKGGDGSTSILHDYYFVLPNGKSTFISGNVSQGYPVDKLLSSIKQLVESKSQRIKELANEKTILFDPSKVKSVVTPKVKETSTTINQGANNSAQKLDALNSNKKLSRRRPKLRAADDNKPTWNQKEELEWLDKVLPQLSREDKVKVVKGLIKVADNGTLAWGQFDNGIITLSDIAAKGTVYHEAFHVVFNLLLDQSERQALYDEARRMYGNKDDLSLEEDMAEGFREYVMTRQNRGLGRRILDFFKDLLAKVTHWNNFRPYLTSYYQSINEGRYANSNFKVPTINESRNRVEEYSFDSNNPDIRYRVVPNSSFNSLSESVKEMLTQQGWTEESFNSISQIEKDHAIKCAAF